MLVDLRILSARGWLTHVETPRISALSTKSRRMSCPVSALTNASAVAVQFIALRDDLVAVYARNADFILASVLPRGLLIKTGESRRPAEERGLSWEDQEAFEL